MYREQHRLCTELMVLAELTHSLIRQAEILANRRHNEGVLQMFSAHELVCRRAGSRGHTADIWNVASGGKVVSLPRHAGGVWSTPFSPDGRSLATACYYGSVQIWDAPS